MRKDSPDSVERGGREKGEEEEEGRREEMSEMRTDFTRAATVNTLCTCVT